jgi:hypothetical protein
MKQISIIRYIVKYSFIIYLFDVIDVNIVLYKLMMYSLRPRKKDVFASRETTTGNYILKYINIYAK